jgi:hypothetical protein
MAPLLFESGIMQNRAWDRGSVALLPNMQLDAPCDHLGFKRWGRI